MTIQSDDREYLIDSDKGVFKITIPKTWKVTYGRVQPTERGGYGTDQFCVRIYETEKQQRAIFTGVKSFRDLSIKLEIPDGFKDDVPQWNVVEEGGELFSRKMMDAMAGERKKEEDPGEDPTFSFNPVSRKRIK